MHFTKETGHTLPLPHIHRIHTHTHTPPTPHTYIHPHPHTHPTRIHRHSWTQKYFTDERGPTHTDIHYPNVNGPDSLPSNRGLGITPTIEDLTPYAKIPYIAPSADVLRPWTSTIGSVFFFYYTSVDSKFTKVGEYKRHKNKKQKKKKK